MGKPDFYNTRAATALSATATGSVMNYSWWDSSWAESAYGIYIEYWTGSQWLLHASWNQLGYVAPGDGDQGANMYGSFDRRSSGGPVGTYRVCIKTASGVSGYRYYPCSNSVYLS